MKKFTESQTVRMVATTAVNSNPLTEVTNEKGNNMKAIQSRWLCVVTLILFAVVTSTAVTAAPIAGPILDPATGHYYYLLANSNWTDAQTQALALGGNLTTINDAAEDTWVFQEFSNYGGEARNLWIGLNAIGLDGGDPANYSWIDGESSSYRDWATGEPNLTDQYTMIVAVTNTTGYGHWNNTSDDVASGYANGSIIPNFGVAEVVPEPASYLLVLLGSLLLGRCVSRRRAA